MPRPLSQVPIAPLTNSPRNSRTFSVPSDLSKSLRSLQSFKDLIVDRKRISIGQVLKEGEPDTDTDTDIDTDTDTDTDIDADTDFNADFDTDC